MAHYLTWPAIAGLAIVGAAGGVTLGRSAVAEINPSYFGQAESDFYSDLVPNRTPPGGADWNAVQQAEYANAGVAQGLGTGCIRCREYPVEYVPVPDPSVAYMSDGWQSGLRTEDYAEAAEDEPAYAEAAPDPRLVQVQRYSTYRVRSDEAEAAPPLQAQPQVQQASAVTVETVTEGPGEPTGL